MGLFTKTEVDKRLLEAEDEIKILKSKLDSFNKFNARGAGRKASITEEDKKNIIQLREAGVSYNKIAAELNLPVGSVFNFMKIYTESQRDYKQKITHITESVLVDDKTIDFENFLEKNKYRNIMDNIQKNNKP